PTVEIEYTSLPIKIVSININGLLQSNKKLLITKALNNNTYDF
ncbi:2713_t:CDS:1, partial [Scutellospora calospora]